MTSSIGLNSRLYGSILAVCPIEGLAIIDMATHEIRVDYRADAMPDQRAAAQVVIDGFDWSEAAQEKFDIQGRATAFANDPAIQYLLSQIKKAAPAYPIPDKATIAADPIILDAVKGK